MGNIDELLKQLKYDLKEDKRVHFAYVNDLKVTIVTVSRVPFMVIDNCADRVSIYKSEEVLEYINSQNNLLEVECFRFLQDENWIGASSTSEINYNDLKQLAFICLNRYYKHLKTYKSKWLYIQTIFG